MRFSEAIEAGLRNYSNFHGRACRSEYWYWHLFVFLATFAGAMAGPFIIGVMLVLFLPTVAVNVRRLHDIDRSGWWIFLAWIPLLGVIVLFIWHCERGSDGFNRFGPDPLELIRRY